MSQIHITDGQSEKVLDVITAEYITYNNHRQSLKDNLELFEFRTFADQSFSQYLGKQNRVIIPNEDETGYIEFVIHESIKRRSNEGLTQEVYASASYLLLKKAKVIYPTTLANQTTSTAISHAIGGTEWQAGIITKAGTRTFHIEQHTDPFKFLKLIAREFDLELNFRVEVEGNKIIGRYVDLLPRVGQWQGREIELGKDLIGIERVEKTDNIVTKLIGLGPIREDGTRLEVIVEDQEALQRWGRPNPQTGRLQHLIEAYEPQSTREDMTLEELTQYTQTELNKRINAVVEYKSDIADLEHVPGMENKKIRFGDTIKIKDIKFNPPLYLEARVHTQDRSITDKSKKHVELGDFIEYTEDEVKAIWQSLQEQIRQKITHYDLVNYTYDKTTIDVKDESVFQDSTYYADVVALTAEERAKLHADQRAIEAEQNAKEEARDYTDAEVEAHRQALMQEIATKAGLEYVNGQLLLKANTRDVIDRFEAIEGDLLEKAGLEYVNGQLMLKADNATVQAINNTVNNLVSVSDSLQQRVLDNEEALSQQGGQITSIVQEVDTVKGTLNLTIDQLTAIDNTIQSQQTQINANAQAISLKANQSALNTTNNNVSALTTRVSNAEAEINVQAGQITQRVTRTEFNNLQIGGRNLIRNTSEEWETTGFASDSAYGVFRNNLNSLYEEERIIGVHATFSFEARVETNNGANTANIRFYGTGGTPKYLLNSSHHDVKTNEWTRIERTVFFTQHATNTGQARIEFWGRTPNVTKIRIRKFKLEKGNRATDWTPAPEDVEQSINSVHQYASSIDQKADSIISSVNSLSQTVNGHTTQISSVNSSITQLSNEISQKVSQTEYTADKNGIVSRLDSAESTLVQQANMIQQRVTQTTFDTELGKKANQSALNTTNSNLNSLTTRVSNAETTITQHANQIASKVAQTEYNADRNGIISRLDNAESSIIQNANQIQQRVTQTTFDLGLAGKEDTVFKQNSAPPHLNGRLWLNTSVTPNVLNRSTGSAWVRATPTTANEVGAYSLTNGNALETRVSTAESTITQHANQIALRVQKNNIISEINQTAESIKIQAERIDLIGKVTAQHLNVTNLSAISSNLGTITAGTINGVNINASEFKANFNGDIETPYGTSRLIHDGLFFNESNDDGTMYGSTRWEMHYGPRGMSGRFERGGIGSREFNFNSGGLSWFGSGGAMNADCSIREDLGKLVLENKFSSIDIISDHQWGSINLKGLTTVDNALLIGSRLRAITSGTIGYLQAGNSASDTNARLAISRFSTVSTNIAQMDIYSNMTVMHGHARVNWLYANAIDINTGTHMYVRTTLGGEGRCTVTGTTDNYRPFRASSFPTSTSLRKNKTQIEVFEEDALAVIKNSFAYLYKLKGHEDNPYKQLGLMVDETPSILHGEAGDSMEMYAVNTFLWRGVQQLVEKTEHHNDEINWLKLENQSLRNRVKELELKIA